jgi:hypothetical protein
VCEICNENFDSAQSIDMHKLRIHNRWSGLSHNVNNDVADNETLLSDSATSVGKRTRKRKGEDGEQESSMNVRTKSVRLKRCAACKRK